MLELRRTQENIDIKREKRRPGSRREINSSRVRGVPGERAVTEVKGIEISMMEKIRSAKFWKEVK